MSDQRLIEQLKRIASEYNHTPDAALSFLKDALKDQALKLAPLDIINGPFPYNIDEHKLSDYHFDELPDWSKKLIPENAILERHCFRNGQEIAKLVTRGRVLMAAQISEADDIHSAKG
ncbi:hypothetical protein NX722_04060 [Endozoicomonas gorgoniicola]|uniref:Uncharacterized protein n=1 Tax=Endozoicomonas gorgoniicola TaxID=1234144 RepID=A0ABT3MR27_9GAMM|nr:hypothetical protein [Endozoicomonas gorgoniicola]MCW7551827.1 hypothetical protein [Endozoicomonas gorgoniicola]